MFFDKCRTAEELKKEYFRLAMMYHPDRGGDAETMKRINAEYEQMWELLKDRHVDAKGKEYTQATTEQAHIYQDIINEIIHFVGIRIEICGSWIWVSGNTRQYKEQLKELGFYWAPQKAMWYYRPPEYKAHHNKPRTMEYIRQKYGSEIIETEPLAMLQ